jgi:3-methylcrotonyl-CoA carboxylase alpha subunit
MPESPAMACRVRIADRDVAIGIACRRPWLGLQIDGRSYAVVEHPPNGYPGRVDPASGCPRAQHPAAEHLAHAPPACAPPVALLPTDTGAFELAIDGTTYRGWRYASDNEIYIRLGARTFIVSRASATSATDGVVSAQHELRADMPGVVVAVHCEAGQAVANGDPLLTIESMKLQATLLASHPAVVERVHTGIDTAFERGALLVSFAQPNSVP